MLLRESNTRRIESFKNRVYEYTSVNDTLTSAITCAKWFQFFCISSVHHLQIIYVQYTSTK